MKAAMKKAIGKRFLTQSEFANVVVQTEGILNSCPITPVSDDSNDTLRPIDFISLTAQMPKEEEVYLLATKTTSSTTKRTNKNYRSISARKRNASTNFGKNGKERTCSA